jgi:hypothetical protein
MFADPHTLTVATLPVVLPRVGSGVDVGTFRLDGASSQYKLTFSHTYGKRARHMARIDHSKITVDPLIPATNAPFSMSCYIVIDAPLVGYTAAELKEKTDALTLLLTQSSGANLTKLLAGES